MKTSSIAAIEGRGAIRERSSNSVDNGARPNHDLCDHASILRRRKIMIEWTTTIASIHVRGNDIEHTDFLLKLEVLVFLK